MQPPGHDFPAQVRRQLLRDAEIPKGVHRRESHPNKGFIVEMDFFATQITMGLLSIRLNRIITARFSILIPFLAKNLPK
jgi:hypothetical protein